MRVEHRWQLSVRRGGELQRPSHGCLRVAAPLVSGMGGDQRDVAIAIHHQDSRAAGSAYRGPPKTGT